MGAVYKYDFNFLEITYTKYFSFIRKVIHFELSPPNANSLRSRGLEKPSWDKAAGGCRSTGLEKPVLERGLLGDTAAEGYRSKGLHKPLLERDRSGDIAAGGCARRGLQTPVLGKG